MRGNNEQQHVADALVCVTIEVDSINMIPLPSTEAYGEEWAEDTRKATMTFIKTVTTTTTAESLSALLGTMVPAGSAFKAREVTIQMSAGAAGTLYIGGPTTVTAGQSIELAAGQSWTVRVGDGTNSLSLANIWLLASASTIRTNCAMEVA